MTRNRGSQRIAVIGAGAWGTALSCVAARNQRGVILWARDHEACREIDEQNTNSRYLPGIKLPDSISATTDLERALDKASTVLLVTPAQTTRQIGERVLEYLSSDIPVVCCSKGIDIETERTPSQTIAAIAPDQNIAALSGPSFAIDVAKGLPTAVTLASPRLQGSIELAEELSGPAFRIYASDDLCGVELGGALKNVIALAVGVCRGLELGASAEAAAITRGFREVSEIAVALGGQSRTLHGLSGLGDLVLSCSSGLSRNFQFGIALGRGQSTENLPLAEGAKITGVVAGIARQERCDCPIIAAVDQIVNGELTAKETVALLLARPLRKE